MKKKHYPQFIELLSRAKTFPLLLFYNKKMVSPYVIASYGFQRHVFKDQSEGAKCQTCRQSFKTDPIVEKEPLQLKDALVYALRDHDDECPFYLNYNKFQIKPFQLSKQAFVENGPILFKELLVNNSGEEARSLLVPIKAALEEAVMGMIKQWENQLQHCFDALLKFTKNSAVEIALSLFGWKISKNNAEPEITCEYCDGTDRTDDFSICDSHRSYCILLQQQMWKIILKELTVEYLGQVKGEFLRTETEIKAKQLEKDLSAILKQAVAQLRQVIMKAQELRPLSEDQKDKSSYSQAIDRISHFDQEVNEVCMSKIQQIKKFNDF